mgnify:CR=1 FL=1
MFFEVIFEVVVVFGPEFPIRVHNKLHQPLPRIAYMDLGIVPLAAPAFFFLLTHCLPELINTFTLSALGVIFRDCLFLFPQNQIFIFRQFISFTVQNFGASLVPRLNVRIARSMASPIIVGFGCFPRPPRRHF